ncbi:MAG: DUF11 domain-containing protein, partial [Chloroflexi bacterium]|nr:DUF11 domain-containing protein [Chloroflexota bacterium]
PAPLAYVPGSAWANTGSLDATGNTVTWTGELLPGEATIVRLAAQVPLTVPNGLQLWNVAHIDDGWHPAFARQVAVTIAAPDLALSTKQADRPLAQPGQPITYTVVLVNTGDGPATGATLSDTLPAGATYVAGSVTLSPDGITGGAWYDPLAHAIGWAGTVSAHGSVTITYRLTLDPGPVRGTTFVNQARIADGRGLYTWREAVVTVPFRSYLPLAMHH